jgi:crotonobetainyl-CoA:carnitine CoA-transferase CaiB-like acyl-CoA transferase
VNTTICPVNDVKSITKDPHFVARLAMRPYAEAGTDLMPSPIKPIGESLPVPGPAAVEAGRDTDAVLRDVLGYDAQRIAALRAAKALG